MIELNDAIFNKSNKDIDAKRGKYLNGVLLPWDSVEEALESPLLHPAYRCLGLTIIVQKEGVTTEYWLRDDLETFIEKIPEIPVNTLQTVTNAGNVTNNAIVINGLNNAGINAGLTLARISSNLSLITHIKNNLSAGGAIKLTDDNVTLGVPDAADAFTVYNTSGDGNPRIISTLRIIGQDAVLNNELTTLGQVKSLTTLQGVSDRGNKTSNVIKITGDNNPDTGFPGINIAYNTTANIGGISQNIGSTTVGSLLFSNATTYLRFGTGSSAQELQLRSESSGQAGSYLNTRLQISDALNNNEAVTLSQVNSLTNLQAVTTRGNSTSNAIRVSGLTGFNPNDAGLWFVSSTGTSAIANYNSGVQGGGITFTTETSGTAANTMSGRTSGSPAINGTDYTTLNQVNTLIGGAPYQLLSQKGQANGYASLDGGGKIPAAQLPNTVMELQGNWNAATNTPTLVNGTGNPGDVWEVTTAGTTNFGAGNISFAVGDWVVYGASGAWHKSLNSNEVTSVFGRTGTVTAQVGDYSTFYAPITGGGGYIWNGTSAQTANFNITGNGTIGSNLFLSNTGVGAVGTSELLVRNTVSGLVEKLPTSTFALASSLSSYVLKAGDTMTGALVGTSSRFTANSSIGAVPSGDTNLKIDKNITGGTTAYGVLSTGIIQSDVTGGARMFQSLPTIAAGSNPSEVIGFFAAQNTYTGSVINNYGFSVSSGLVGGTNNYGYYNNMPVGTGRWGYYGNGLASNYFAGSVFIGSTVDLSSKLALFTLSDAQKGLAIRSNSPTSTGNLFETQNSTGGFLVGIGATGKMGLGTSVPTTTNISVRLPITGGIVSYGVSVDGVVQPDVTTLAYMYNALPTISATTALASLRNYYTNGAVLAAGGSVNSQSGFHVGSGFTQATGTNYGFLSEVPAGTGRFSFASLGSADNYFNGNTYFGASTSLSAKLNVSTGFDSNKGIVVRGNSATQSGNLFEAQLNTGSAVFKISPTGLVDATSANFAGNVVISGASSTAVTQTAGTSNTTIATTAFVQAAITAGTTPTLDQVLTAGGTSNKNASFGNISLLGTVVASGATFGSVSVGAGWNGATNSLTPRSYVDLKQNLITLTTTGTSGAATFNQSTGELNIPSYTSGGGSGTVTSVDMSVPTGLSISGNPITTSGTLALTLTSGYSIPTTSNQSTWSAKQDAITLTTTGTSGAATFSGGVLNIPNYAGGTSGTFNPTTSNLTNVFASGTERSNYIRVGNIVTYFGCVNISPLTGGNTLTSLDIDLPITSNFTVNEDVLGTVSAENVSNSPTVAANFFAVISSSVIRIQFYAQDTGQRKVRFSFQYIVK